MSRYDELLNSSRESFRPALVRKLKGLGREIQSVRDEVQGLRGRSDERARRSSLERDRSQGSGGASESPAVVNWEDIRGRPGAGDDFLINDERYMPRSELRDKLYGAFSDIPLTITGAPGEISVAPSETQRLEQHPEWELRLPQPVDPRGPIQMSELLLGSEADLGNGNRASFRTARLPDGTREVQLRGEGDLGNPEWFSLHLQDIILEGEQKTIQGRTLEIEDNQVDVNSNLDPRDYDDPSEIPPVPTLSGIGAFLGTRDEDGEPRKAEMLYDSGLGEWVAGEYPLAGPVTAENDGVEETVGVTSDDGSFERRPVAIRNYLLQSGLNAELVAGKDIAWLTNASHLDHGILPEGRLVGNYSYLTGSGDLQTGSIGQGLESFAGQSVRPAGSFGPINIGTSKLDSGNVELHEASGQGPSWIRGSESTSGALRIDSGKGYVDIGPQTEEDEVAHFFTSEILYRFDRALQTEAVGSLPGEDFFIRSGEKNWLHLDQDALGGEALFRVLEPTRFESEVTYLGHPTDVRHVFSVEGSRLTTRHGGIYTTFSAGGAQSSGFLSVGQPLTNSQGGPGDTDQRLGQSPQTQVLEARGDVFSSGDILTSGGLYVGGGMGLLAPSSRPGEGWILADEGLGVGTSSPEAEVHVVGSGGDVGQLLIDNAAGGRAAFNQFSGGVLNLENRSASGKLGALEYHGTALYPEARYYTQLGTLTNKWSQAFIGELNVETLTASERRTTMGGRFTVGLGNRLTEPLGADSEHVTVEHNNLGEGDVLHLEGGGKFEFLRVLSSEPEEITVERPTPENPLTPVDDKVWRYPVERGLDPTPLNEWAEGTGMLNTGTPGTGFIDQYALSSLASFDLVETPDPVADSSAVASGIGEDREYTYSLRFAEGESGSVTVALVGRSGEDAFTESLEAEGRQQVTFEAPVGDGSYTLELRGSGQKVEDSRLEYARDQRVAGPSSQYAVRTGTGYQDIEPRAQVGNLRHTYDYGNDAFGLAAGERSGAWISADDEQGIRISRGSTVRGQWDPEGRVWIGPRDEAHLKITPGSIDDGDDSSRLEGFSGAGVPSSFRIDENSLRMGRASTAHLYSAVGEDDVELTMRVPQYDSDGELTGYKRRLQLLSDGSAYFASRDVRIDADGKFVVEDRADIAGFEVRGLEYSNGEVYERRLESQDGKLSLVSYSEDSPAPVISAQEGTLEAALGEVSTFREGYGTAFGFRAGTQVSQYFEATQDQSGEIFAKLAGFRFDADRLWNLNGTDGTFLGMDSEKIWMGARTYKGDDAKGFLHTDGTIRFGGRDPEGDGMEVGALSGRVDGSGSDYSIGINPDGGAFFRGHVTMDSGQAGSAVFFGSEALSAFEGTRRMVIGTGAVSDVNADSPELRLTGPSPDDRVRIFHTELSGGEERWGVQGEVGGERIFEVGSTNQLVGWGFSEGVLSSENGEIVLDAASEQIRVSEAMRLGSLSSSSSGLGFGEGDYIYSAGDFQLAGGDIIHDASEDLTIFEGTIRARSGWFENLAILGPILVGGNDGTSGYLTTQGSDEDKAASWPEYWHGNSKGRREGFWLGYNWDTSQGEKAGAKFALGDLLKFESADPDTSGSEDQAFYYGDIELVGDQGELRMSPDPSVDQEPPVNVLLPEEGVSGGDSPYQDSVDLGVPDGTPVEVVLEVRSTTSDGVVGVITSGDGETSRFSLRGEFKTTDGSTVYDSKRVRYLDRTGGSELSFDAKTVSGDGFATLGDFEVTGRYVIEASASTFLTPQGLSVYNTPTNYFKVGSGRLEAAGRMRIKGDMEVEGDLVIRGDRVEEFDQSVPGDLVLNSGQTIRIGEDAILDSSGVVEKDNLPSDILYVDGEGTVDADTLGGEAPAYYTNASNLDSGRVPTARLSGEYDIDISGDADTLDGYDSSEFVLKENHNELENPEITGDVFLLTDSADIEWSADDVRLSATGDLLEVRDLADNGYSRFKAERVLLGRQATSSGHAVRADRSVDTSAPLEGGGALTSDLNISLDYNTNHFSVSGSKLQAESFSGDSKQGFSVGGTTLGGSLSVDVPQDLRESATPQFDGLYSTGVIRSDNYASGWTGSGYILDRDESFIETTELSVRGTLLARELEIRKLTFSKGPLGISPGAGKVSAVEPHGNDQIDYDIEFEEEHGCVVGDRLLAQRFDPSSGAVIEQTRLVVKQVDSPTNLDVGHIGGSAPERGMEFIVVASSDSDRDSMLYLNPYGPHLDVLDQISNFSEWDARQPKLRLGRIDNMPRVGGVDPSGYGLWGENVYLKDGVFEGTIRVTGGNAATTSYADDRAGEAYDDAYSDAKGYADTVTGGILEDAKAHTDKVAYTYDRNEYTGTDAADAYDPKPSTATMQNEGAGGWPTGYGTVQTAWSKADRGTQRYIAHTGEVYERYTRVAIYPEWSEWRQTEDVAGSQSKVNTLQASVESKIGEAITEGETLIQGGYLNNVLIETETILADLALIEEGVVIGGETGGGFDPSVSFDPSFSDSGWDFLDGQVTRGISDPNGGSDAIRFDSGSNSNAAIRNVPANYSSGDTFWVWLRSAEGSDVEVEIAKASSSTGKQVTITTEWQLFSAEVSGESLHVIGGWRAYPSGTAVDLYAPFFADEYSFEPTDTQGLVVTPTGIESMDGSMFWGRLSGGGYGMVFNDADGEQRSLAGMSAVVDENSSFLETRVVYNENEAVFELWADGEKSSANLAADQVEINADDLDIDASNLDITGDDVNFDVGQYTISGDHLQIDSTTVFGSGYDPTEVLEDAKAHTDKVALKYDRNEYQGTDGADAYRLPRPAMATMQNEGAGGWPTGYGTVTTNWSKTERATQRYVAHTGAIYERYVRQGTYPDWSDWREIEDVDGSQEKADQALAEANGYTDSLESSVDSAFGFAVSSGTTLIKNGYLENDFINTGTIVVGDFQDDGTYETPSGAQTRADEAYNEATGYTDTLKTTVSDALGFDVTDGRTIIQGGYLRTVLVDAQVLEVDDLSALDADIGSWHIGDTSMYSGNLFAAHTNGGTDWVTYVSTETQDENAYGRPRFARGRMLRGFGIAGAYNGPNNSHLQIGMGQVADWTGDISQDPAVDGAGNPVFGFQMVTGFTNEVFTFAKSTDGSLDRAYLGTDVTFAGELEGPSGSLGDLDISGALSMGTDATIEGDGYVIRGSTIHAGLPTGESYSESSVRLDGSGLSILNGRFGQRSKINFLHDGPEVGYEGSVGMSGGHLTVTGELGVTLRDGASNRLLMRANSSSDSARFYTSSVHLGDHGTWDDDLKGLLFRSARTSHPSKSEVPQGGFLIYAYRGTSNDNINLGVAEHRPDGSFDTRSYF